MRVRELPTLNKVYLLLYIWRCMRCFSFYPWKPRKILVLVIVRAMPLNSLFLVRRKVFTRSMCPTSLIKLLSKLVWPETKGEVDSEIKRNDLSCHKI